MDPRWFKLLVRAVGLMLIGFAAPMLVKNVLTFLYVLMFDEQPASLSYTLSYVAAIFGDLVQGGFGVYLLLGGGKLTQWCLRQTLGSCLVCEYDVRTITAPTCPECGAPIPRNTPKQAHSRDAVDEP